MGRVSTASMVLTALCGVVFAVTSSAQGTGGNAEARKMKNPVATNTQSVAAGKATYQKYCRFCHGPEALGDGTAAPKGSQPSNLTDAVWARGSTDGEIFVVLRDGAGPKFEMKGFKGRMTDQDMWHVINYLRSIAKK